MSQEHVSLATDRLHLLQTQWQQIRPVQAVLDQAQRLLYAYPLRAADSLQLAAALAWCRNRPDGRIFLTADERLAQVAAQAGFTVLQP